MYHYHLPSITWVAMLLLMMSFSAFGAEQTAQLIDNQITPPTTPVQEKPEVLSSGPVHEAFAEPVNLQLQAGLIAPDRPPPNIEEVPPPERPQGQQFVWISGYWAWDANRHSYIWVSACWRVAPPRMSWVPGYWAQVSEGWEWISGFWTPIGARQIEYLPAPSAIVDVEPQGTAPSSDTIWVPPCMYWVKGQYVRRAGYWLTAQSNWVWAPSHYIATPRGYIFAEGHWDYSMDRRGLLFAPICFPKSLYGREHLTYSPSIIIDIGLLRLNLFAYPRYNHYYFGDYYDDAYLRIGIFPWFDCRRLHTWYDPIYEHDRWHYQRSEPRWEALRRETYNRRRVDKELRPARTFHEQESRLAKLPESQRQSLKVAHPITITHNKPAQKFDQLNTEARQKISKQATATHTFRDERVRWESTPVTHPKTVQFPKERDATTITPRIKNTPIERRQTVQSPNNLAREKTAPLSAPHSEASSPVPPRVPKFVSPHETRVSQPERVQQVPASPIASRSGISTIFQKGPPSRPTDEGKDKDGKDFRRK